MFELDIIKCKWIYNDTFQNLKESLYSNRRGRFQIPRCPEICPREFEANMRTSQQWSQRWWSHSENCITKGGADMRWYEIWVGSWCKKRTFIDFHYRVKIWKYLWNYCREYKCWKIVHLTENWKLLQSFLFSIAQGYSFVRSLLVYIFLYWGKN